MTGFDTQFGLVVQICNQTMKKKTLGFWMKCGFEINKEIKRNEAKKWWVLIQSFDLVYIHNQTKRKKTVGVWTKCGFEINKEIKRNEAEK